MRLLIVFFISVYSFSQDYSFQKYKKIIIENEKDTIINNKGYSKIYYRNFEDKYYMRYDGEQVYLMENGIEKILLTNSCSTFDGDYIEFGYFKSFKLDAFDKTTLKSKAKQKYEIPHSPYLHSVELICQNSQSIVIKIIFHDGLENKDFAILNLLKFDSILEVSERRKILHRTPCIRGCNKE